MTGPHEHEGVGTNSRLDAVQAAVVGAHLSELDRRVARRREHARAYDSLGLGLPGDPRDAVHQYIVMHPQRDRLRADLAARGIESAVYYPRPLDGQGSASRCDRALAFCARSLAIPVHAELTDQEHNRVLEGLRAWA